MPERKKIYMAAVVLCIIITGVFYSYTKSQKNQQRAVELETYALIKETEAIDSFSEEPESSKDIRIFVHVGGAVVRPGVYEVAEGTRGFEVIDLAGGFTDSAARDYLNLAQVVKDGDKLIVPDLNNPDDFFSGAMAAGKSADSLVNINQADKTELMTLPGIGEAKAEAILKYREKAGGFSNIEEIMNISGIKEAAFEKIKDSITVN